MASKHFDNFNAQLSHQALHPSASGCSEVQKNHTACQRLQRRWTDVQKSAVLTVLPCFHTTKQPASSPAHPYQSELCLSDTSTINTNAFSGDTSPILSSNSLFIKRLKSARESKKLLNFILKREEEKLRSASDHVSVHQT